MKNDENINLKIIERLTTDRRIYNAPTVNEVAALIPGDVSNTTGRDLIVVRNGDRFQRLHSTNGAHLPMQYPILFPNGDMGYHLGIQKHGSSKNVTMLEYYKYRLFQRYQENATTLDISLLHYGGELFQQYVVDVYAMIEQNNLNFLRNNQEQIRAVCIKVL